MKGPLPWIGGKSLLARTILESFPEHLTYCEVFAGGAHVLFAKEPSKFEIMNDVNKELVCLFRVLQYHLEEFCRQFKWCLVSRDWWNDWTEQLQAGGLTDIQRAARFYYIQRLGFGGKVAGRTFGGGPQSGPRINLIRLEEDLSAIHLRLARVRIENMPFAQFIERHDRPETLFYLDPPYYGMEGYYGKDIFSRADFTALSIQLSEIKGKFVLSLNDKPEVREIFNPFRIQGLTTRYTCSKAASIPAKEVLISNF
ncbi:DNA adenine methylase [Fundidesulfovibrio butyratiphilus]